MDSIARCVVADAVDVVVETDMTDVCVMPTAGMEVSCEFFSWHEAGAVAGTVVIGREWGWTTSTC